jgi:NAD(P)-dependent dehydrogenase (short-subunit alcohol dehydrogenase family)
MELFKISRRIAVITGASSGIGRESARLLAASGWHVIGQGRDPSRCAEALAYIKKGAMHGTFVTMLRCDLSLLSETEILSREITALAPYVDVLLNNAGGMQSTLKLTVEGNEATFAANHLGHFLLTKRMMPLLRVATGLRTKRSVRIVNMSSLGHEYCTGIDWSDLQQTQHWNSSKNYCFAKLCNLLFTHELSARTPIDGIVALAMHPGVVDSNFHAHATAELQQHMRTRPGDPPNKSAETLVWLATEPGLGSTGDFYFHEKKPVTPSAMARDRELARRLWEESEALLERSGH